MKPVKIAFAGSNKMSYVIGWGRITLPSILAVVCLSLRGSLEGLLRRSDFEMNPMRPSPRTWRASPRVEGCDMGKSFLQCE